MSEMTCGCKCICEIKPLGMTNEEKIYIKNIEVTKDGTIPPLYIPPPHNK